MLKQIAVAAFSTSLFVALPAVEAKAVGVISVDLDPSTAGIQSALTVSPGETFTIDLILEDDGTPLSPVVFETFFLENYFNDAGVVLGLGPTGPLAGSIASTPGTFDSMFAPVSPGSSIGTVAGGPPPMSFTAGTGAVFLGNSPVIPPGTGFTVSPGSPVSLFSLDFVALAAGTSTILPGNTGFPAILDCPSGLVCNPAGNVPIGSIVSGTVTVVPEPTTILGTLFAAVGGGLIQRKRRKQKLAS